jgi:ABC-2 type transport system permease protein
MLGEPWRAISHANPILYMVNAFRYGVLGISDVNVPMAFVIMLGFVVALSAFALYLLKRGVGLRT